MVSEFRRTETTLLPFLRAGVPSVIVDAPPVGVSSGGYTVRRMSPTTMGTPYTTAQCLPSRMTFPRPSTVRVRRNDPPHSSPDLPLLSSAFIFPCQ